MTQQDGNRHRDHAERGTDTADPLHRIPFLGRLIRKSDELRHEIPFLGEHLTRTDADVLRMEARLLRLAASQLEGRAQQLDRLAKKEPEPAARRVRVE